VRHANSTAYSFQTTFTPLSTPTSKLSSAPTPAGSFDAIIDTVSAQHDVNALLGLLTPRGKLVMVGLPPTKPVIDHFAMVMKYVPGPVCAAGCWCFEPPNPSILILLLSEPPAVFACVSWWQLAATSWDSPHLGQLEASFSAVRFSRYCRQLPSV
jgi:hypothetical protein